MAGVSEVTVAQPTSLGDSEKNALGGENRLI